ncbi:MAG: hypothetical protein ACWA5Q_00100 [bacterium]
MSNDSLSINSKDEEGMCVAHANGIDFQNPDELYRLGTIYFTDVVGCKNTLEAEKYYLLAANLGHTSSQAMMCVIGEMKENFIDAVMWCTLATTGGDSNSQLRLNQYRSSIDENSWNLGIERASSFRVAQ